MLVSSWGPLSVHYATLEQASPARKGDKEFVRAVVAKDGRALKLAAPALQHDTEVVLAAGMSECMTLCFEYVLGLCHIRFMTAAPVEAAPAPTNHSSCLVRCNSLV